MTQQWVVECPAFVAGPFGSRAVAERRLAEIEKLGACGYDDHVIHEVV